jgi:hypothetical protein
MTRWSHATRLERYAGGIAAGVLLLILLLIWWLH